MNCKPGDLAIVVRSAAGHEGVICRVIRFVGELPEWTGNDRWETDHKHSGLFGGITNTFQDRCLRPLRDQPGEDEMLRIAGKPANYKGKVVTAKPVKLEEL